MDNLNNAIRKELQRLADNCEYYNAAGMDEHYINEVGCLRGAMYIADLVGVQYPQYIYYRNYIEPVYNRIKEHDPVHPCLHT